ncbi:MAG TPA: PP2C family protein-serine/threonine phosphatase [Acidimicrobiales bacterium]|nr:PP2C family protein-serine/threonine phosphatase [Acidimicrobiales bacterium]
MPVPDYEAVLDTLPDRSPAELVDVLATAARPLAARDLRVYLSDFEGSTLQLVLPDGEADQEEVASADVAGSLAGRVFRTGEVAVAERDEGVQVWVPLLERAERTGVVTFTVPEGSDEILAECVRLGRFAGLLVRSFARTTDLFHLRRRRQSMTLAAGMQWDLLPPLTVRCARALACGRLEPAYEIAGDAFDYALNGEHLHAGVFDGMGHGVHSTLMTGLAVGAYRHARRAGHPLASLHGAIDEAMAGQYGGEAFVTAALARLRMDDGLLEWSNAGHPGPLLLRERRVVRQLVCAPSLPLGLGGECREVAAEQLEPADCVLFFTDGVVEGRAATGGEFGVERLVERVEHHAASGAAPDEMLRRLLDDVMDYNARKLRDDASLLLVSWHGSPPASSDPERSAAP